MVTFSEGDVKYRMSLHQHFTVRGKAFPLFSIVVGFAVSQECDKLHVFVLLTSRARRTERLVKGQLFIAAIK